MRASSLLRSCLLPTLLAQALVGCSSGGGAKDEPVPLSMPQETGSRADAVAVATDTSGSVPPYLVETIDVAAGTRIERIADQAAFGSGERFLRHAYARNQPWNADGSLIMLDFTYPAALIDAQTLRFRKWFQKPSDAVWSHVDPHKLIGTIGKTNLLVSTDITQDAPFTTLHEFSAYERISFGAGEGNLSNDDRYIALFGFAGGRTDLLVHDLKDGVTVAVISFGAAVVCDCAEPLSINNATMSQSGRYVLVQYNERGSGRYKGVEVFDRDLRFIRQVTRGSEHGDVGVTADGQDVWVSWHDTTGRDPFQSANAYAWRLDTGDVTAVIPKGTPLGHISCRNIRRPGYCYASHSNVTPKEASTRNDFMYAFALDGSMTIEPLAQQRSSGRSYERQPMGVPDPSGTRALWASDWNDDKAPVYAYVASRQ